MLDRDLCWLERKSSRRSRNIQPTRSNICPLRGDFCPLHTTICETRTNICGARDNFSGLHKNARRLIHAGARIRRKEQSGPLHETRSAFFGRSFV
jgi:hypothetical protein